MKAEDSLLHQLGLKHGTDKASVHDYCRRYEEFFHPLRQSAKKILEIGIAGGNSLRMWHEYFPYAVIHGVDHTQAYVDAMFNKDPLIQVDLGEASDPQFWAAYQRNWGADYDLIIDDASHAVLATFVAFSCAFKLVRPGGFYCIEDVHASFDPAYRRDNEPGGLAEEDTVPFCIAAMAVGMLHENGAGQVGTQTTAEIESITSFKSLIIIKKRE